jgi:hypothetical protein
VGARASWGAGVLCPYKRREINRADGLRGGAALFFNWLTNENSQFFGTLSGNANAHKTPCTGTIKYCRPSI